MVNILIVSSLSKSKELLTNIAKESGQYNVYAVDTSVQCRDIIKTKHFELIIINSNMKDTVDEELLYYINGKTNSDIILIVKDITKKIFQEFEKKGIYVMQKPLNKIILTKIINSYIIHRRRYNSIIEENENLKKKISDIKLIDRAKLTLVQYLKMSENESHRYIEKQAMDLRITKVEVAKNILKIYEF